MRILLAFLQLLREDIETDKRTWQTYESHSLNFSLRTRYKLIISIFDSDISRISEQSLYNDYVTHCPSFLE
jgi:hypothetical protein